MKNSRKSLNDGVQFLDFWLQVADELGNSRLRINKNSNSIHDLLDRDCDGRDYLKKIVRKSYKLSHCQHLKSLISMEVVLDLLGETAFQLQGQQQDDLFDIELLEEIAWLISSRYQRYIEELIKGDDESQLDSSQHTPTNAQIVSFPNYKIRRANSRQ